MSRVRSAGFTLLEILIAIAVTAMLVFLAVQVHLDIQTDLERVHAGRDRSRSAQILLDRIARELVGTILVVKQEGQNRLYHPYFFVGDDRVFGSGDSDAIRFITLSPSRPAGQHASGGIRMVSYAVEPDGGEGFNLLRQEDPLPDGLDTAIRVDQGQVIAEELAGFTLRYLNEETGEWEERWDSTDIARLDRLPLAVEVQVELLQEEPEDPEELEDDADSDAAFSRIVHLHMRPIVQQELEPEDAGEDEEVDDQNETQLR